MENAEVQAEQGKANSFKNRRVFTTKKDYWGMPGDLFIGGMAVSIGLSVAVIWWAGFLLGAVYFPTIYRIHKDDPRAAKAWLRGLKRRHNHWVAGEVEPFAVTFLPSRGGKKHNISKEEAQNEVDCFV
jgi:hypothetical protein